jgi:hypothetical protein
MVVVLSLKSFSVLDLRMENYVVSGLGMCNNNHTQLVTLGEFIQV